MLWSSLFTLKPCVFSPVHMNSGLSWHSWENSNLTPCSFIRRKRKRSWCQLGHMAFFAPFNPDTSLNHDMTHQNLGVSDWLLLSLLRIWGCLNEWLKLIGSLALSFETEMGYLLFCELCMTFFTVFCSRKLSVLQGSEVLLPYSKGISEMWGAGEKAQQVKALAAKRHYLSSIPGTHKEVERTNSHKLCAEFPQLSHARR